MLNDKEIEKEFLSISFHERSIFCWEFYRLSYPFLGMNPARALKVDQDGRNMLHQVYLNRCYEARMMPWSSKPDTFSQQLSAITESKGFNLFTRDKYDKFAFEYIDASHRNENIYPILRCVHSGVAEEKHAMLFHVPSIKLASQPDLFNQCLTSKANELLEMDTYLHPDTGNNMIHKMAASPNIELRYVQYIQQMPIPRGKIEEVLLSKYENGDAALLSYILSSSNLDPYQENYEGKMPMEIAYKPSTKQVLYERFIKDIEAKKTITKPEPYIKYAVEEVRDKKFIELIVNKTFIYPICKQQVDFNGNSVLQLALKYNIFRPDIINSESDLPTCRNSINLPNFDGESMHRQLKMNLHLWCPKDGNNNYKYQICHWFNDVLAQPKSFLKSEIEELKNEFDTRVAKLTDSVRETNLIFEQFQKLASQAIAKDIERDHSASMVKNMLNPKQWLEKIKSGTLHKNALPDFSHDAQSFSQLVFDYASDKMGELMLTIGSLFFTNKVLECYNVHCLTNYIAIEEAEGKVVMAKKETENEYHKLEEIIIEREEQDGKIRDYLKDTNLKEWSKIVFNAIKAHVDIREKEMDERIAMRKNKLIAPKEFENTYKALKELSDKGETTSEQYNSLVHKIESECKNYQQQHQDKALDLAFCLNTASYDFSHTYEFIA
jgi:hypothetical protein